MGHDGIVGSELGTSALRLEATADLSSEEPHERLHHQSAAFAVAVLLQCLFAAPLVIQALQLAARLELFQLREVNIASLTLV